MITNSRWTKAQRYEERHWQKIANKIMTGVIKQLDWYDWKAKQFEQKLFSCVPNLNKQNCKILEIGSGPIGIISFLKWGERYAIDPLEEFYRTNELLISNRDPNVKYIKGHGEDIPFEDKEISLVIIDNVLDHTNNPNKVLEEIYRILNYKGLLYLAINIRSNWGTFFHSILAKIGIDKGHPHSYSYKNILQILRDRSFNIAYEEREDYNRIRKQYLKSWKIKNILKAYTGLTEILYLCLCSVKK